MFKENFSGKFGENEFGGQYIPELLMPLVKELEESYNFHRKTSEFWAEFSYYQKHYTGRPSPLYFAERTFWHCKGLFQKG